METVVCEICGSGNGLVTLCQRDLMLGGSEETFTVVRCQGCGFRYLNPRPTEAEIGRYYPERYYAPTPPKSRTGFERSLKRFSRRVKRWIREDFYGYPASGATGPWQSLRKILLWPEKTRRVFRGKNILPWVGQGRLLDVGCGTGVNLKTFQEQGWDVYGIEISKVAAAQARDRVGDRIHTGTLEDAPFKEEFFDVIVLSHTLEHLFSPWDVLARLRQLLKPEGLLVITVPNASSLEARLFVRWWVGWDPPRHLYHFEKSALDRLLTRIGFRPVNFRTGVGTHFFMSSLDQFWKERHTGRVPFRKLIEKLVASPVCLISGHLGYGPEITVYAVKAPLQPACCV